MTPNSTRVYRSTRHETNVKRARTSDIVSKRALVNARRMN
jgi:hypothetical protein